MTSPFLTRWPRRTRNSVSTPPVRAVTVTLRSASVRPDSTSLRLCWHDRRSSITATRNSFCASASAGAIAARLSAVSCGSRCPDAIQSAAAATRPTAAMRLAFIDELPPRLAASPAAGCAACGA